MESRGRDLKRERLDMVSGGRDVFRNNAGG